MCVYIYIYTWPHNRAEPMPVPVKIMADVHRKIFCPSNSVPLVFEFSKMQQVRVIFRICAPEGSDLQKDHSTACLELR